jgi:hypothetical protein
VFLRCHADSASLRQARALKFRLDGDLPHRRGSTCRVFRQWRNEPGLILAIGNLAVCKPYRQVKVLMVTCVMMRTRSSDMSSGSVVVSLAPRNDSRRS